MKEPQPWKLALWVGFSILIAGFSFDGRLSATLTTGDPPTLADQIRQATHVAIGVTAAAPAVICEDYPWVRPIRIERYLKGKGPEEVQVRFYSGECQSKTPGGPPHQGISGSPPSLTPPGVRVLLLLDLGVPPSIGTASYPGRTHVFRLDWQRDPNEFIRTVEQLCKQSRGA